MALLHTGVVAVRDRARLQEIVGTLLKFGLADVVISRAGASSISAYPYTTVRGVFRSWDILTSIRRSRSSCRRALAVRLPCSSSSRFTRAAS